MSPQGQRGRPGPFRWKGEVVYEAEKRKQCSIAAALGRRTKNFGCFLAILLSMCSGLCIIVPYIGIYRLMDATFNNACTKELVVQTVAMIAAAVTLRLHYSAVPAWRAH